MKINTGDHAPIKLKPCRRCLHRRALVKGSVRDMLETGIFGRSEFPWSFPVVVIDKKDGDRFCVDFRSLNAISKSQTVPLST